MKGRVKELWDKITEFKNQPGGSPDILSLNGCSVEEIFQFVGSWLSMIAALMKKNIYDSEIIKVEREIKIFLSNLDIVQKSIIEKEKVGERIFNFSNI